MAYDIGPRIGIEGEVEFRRSINAINESYKTLKTEMKAVTSEFDKNDKSQEALTEQSKTLTKQVDLQKQKLGEVTTMLEKSKEKYGENSKETLGWQRTVNSTTAELNQLEGQLKKVNTTLDNQGNKWSSLGKTLETAGGKIKGIGDGLTSAGKTLTMGITAPVIAAGALMTSYASDLEENLNKTDVAFKENAKEVIKWSETTLDKYGISQSAALEMSSLFGDMATSMEISTGEASTMSRSLSGLAGDLASFKNISIDEAMTALKGVFTGEGEALKSLGIVMQDSTLSAYALSKGYEKTYQEMEQSEKVALRYAFVMDSTKNAQGDFSRTSDGTANSIRVMKESVKELGASFGKELLPVITPVIRSVTDMIKSFGKLDDETKKNIIGVTGLAAAAGPLLLGLGKITKVAGGTVSGISTFCSAVAVMKTGAVAATPAIAGMTSTLTFLTGPVGLAIAGISLLTVGLGALYVNMKNNTYQTAEQAEQNKKFIESNKQVSDSVTSNMEIREKSLKSTEGEIVVAKTLSDKIFELAEKQNRSGYEQTLLNEYINKFNEVMPTANLCVDESTGLLNLNRDAINEVIAGETERIRIAAVSELLVQNTKDQLEVKRQLADAQGYENILRAECNAAVETAIAQGGNDAQITERLIKIYAEYEQKLVTAKGSTEELVKKEAELSTEQGNLNTILSDPTAWDSYMNSTTNATSATELYAVNAREALLRYQQESGRISLETGQAYPINTAIGISQTTGKSEEAARNLHGVVSGKIAPLGAFGLETGKNTVEGLNNGMEERRNNVITGADKIVKAVVDMFKKGFGINSPSKVFHGFGVNLIDGLVGGMEGPDLMGFTNSMIEKLKSAFANANFSIPAAIEFLGSGAKEILKSMGIGGASLSDLLFPTDSRTITSEFGGRESPGGIGSTWHEGIDIGAPEGAPVRAAGAGTVTTAGWGGGYGNLVEIDHGGGLSTLYAHMSAILTSVGETVREGQNIGLVGSTGNSTGAHLHFGVYENGSAIDPSKIFGYAGGTRSASPGLHWVGEKGPELMMFSGGETVFNNTESIEISKRYNTEKDLAIQNTTIINTPTPLSAYEYSRINQRDVRDLALSLRR